MPYVTDIISWGVILLGGIIALYLVWGVVKASIRLLFYISLLMLFLGLLNRYHMLPPEVSLWLNPHTILEQIREKISGPNEAPRHPPYTHEDEDEDDSTSESNKELGPRIYSSMSGA